MFLSIVKIARKSLSGEWGIDLNEICAMMYLNMDIDNKIREFMKYPDGRYILYNDHDMKDYMKNWRDK